MDLGFLIRLSPIRTSSSYRAGDSQLAKEVAMPKIPNELNLIELQNREACSPAETAALIGIGETKLREEVSTGRLVANKVGSRTLITKAHRKRYLESLPQAEYAEPRCLKRP
jgi:hypothetical protein